MQSISRRRALWSIIISGFVWLFLLGAVTVGAQAAATPITLGENKTGSIADASSPALYSMQIGAPQSVIVLILAVTPGFAPTFRVLDEGGVVVFDTANSGSQNIAQAMLNLSSSGTYVFEVRSANAVAGQFLISTQAGAPLTPPQALTPGTPLNGSVNGQTTRQAYSFSASNSEVLLLTVQPDASAAGAVIALRDANSDETLSLSSARLGGIRYRILSGQANYLLEVTHSGASTAEAFSVCLAIESGSATCPGDSASTTVAEAAVAPTVIAAVPSQTPTFAPIAINPNGACEVTAARNNSVNVRSGAGTGFGIIGSLLPGATGLVVGRLADNSWFQVNAGGTLGWVSATVVILGGNCGGVTIIVLPTAIPPTNAPPPVNPPSNNPPSNSNNNSSSGSNTDNPPAEVQPETPKLIPGEFPSSGVFNLEGSEIDQAARIFDVSLTGNDIDVSYLGGGCTGLVGKVPALRIILNTPLPGLLRFYYVHADATDAVMVIQDPDGHIHCGDDSYGTVNPTIDLNGPSGGFPRTSPPSEGEYYIWIGSHTTLTFGKVYITNSDIFHP